MTDMAVLEIPLNPNAAIFRIAVPLDGATYLLDIDWSDRSGAWFIDVYAQSDTESIPILLGQKLVVDYPLLQGVVADGRPPGELMLIDLNGDGECGRDDLGTRCLLLYLDAESVA